MKKQFLSIKKILLVGFLIIGLFGFAKNAKAANFNIADALDVSFSGNTLFEVNNMAPGQEVSKIITIINKGIYPHSFSIATDKITNGLANLLQIEPRIDGAPIWNKTLSQIAINPNTDIIISEIQPGKTVYIDMTAIFPLSAGNEYMNSSIPDISFYVGNESTDMFEPKSQNKHTSKSSDSTSNSPIKFSAFGSSEKSSLSDNQTNDENSDQVSGAEDQKNIKGVEDEKINKNWNWLWILIIVIISIIIYKWYSKKR